MYALRRPISWLVVGAAALGVVAGAPASPATDRPPPSAGTAVLENLALHEALTLAIEHSATLRQSATGVANARSRLLSAAQLRQTMLEADTTARSRSPGASSLQGTAGALYSREFLGGATLSLSGLVPWIDTRDLVDGEAGVTLALPLMQGRGKSSEKQIAIDQAAIGFDQERLRYFIDRQNLLEQVARAYFGAVRARERVEVQKQAVAIAQQATDDAQKRLDAGLITEIDLTRAKIQLAGTRETLLNQEADYRNALDQLVLLLGLPVGATPELSDPVPGTGEERAPADTGDDLDAAIREALANRPELKLRELQEANAHLDLQVAKDRKRPRADLTANLSTLGLSLFSGAGIGRVLTSVLGLRLAVPVNKTALRENEATAERNIDSLARMREFDRQGIVEEVRALVRRRETSRGNIALLTENLKVAEQSLHLAQRLIEEGLADNRNLLDAQSALTATQSSLISARIDDYLTTVSLARAVGHDLMHHFNLSRPTGACSVLGARCSAGQGRRHFLCYLHREDASVRPSTEHRAPSTGAKRP